MRMSELLYKVLKEIKPLDGDAMEAAAKHWDSIAKPLHSLGMLEDVIVELAGMRHTPNVSLNNKLLVTFCADNGVVAEGVSQTDSEVTAIVAENFLRGDATAAICCRNTGTRHIVVDMGMLRDIRVPEGIVVNPDWLRENDRKVNADDDRIVYVDQYKLSYGTKNLREMPAMSREEAEKALEAGITIARAAKGTDIFAIGEMGIGNTTTGSAITAVLLGKEAAEVTGRGAGLDNARLQNKIRVIEEAIVKHQPDPQDPVDVLAKLGGFDIAGMAGLILGAASVGKPVVIDGFISSVAALLAVRICPQAGDYLIASHVSKEPAANALLQALGKEAMLHCNMFPGEGGGAVMLFPMLELALAVYKGMPSFEAVNIEAYVPLGG